MNRLATATYLVGLYLGLVVVVLGLTVLITYGSYLLHARPLTFFVWIVLSIVVISKGMKLVEADDARWTPHHGGAFGLCGVLVTVATFMFAFGLGLVLEIRSLIHNGDRIDAVVVDERIIFSEEGVPGYMYKIRRMDGTAIPGELGAEGAQLGVGEVVSVVVDPDNHSAPLLDPESTLKHEVWLAAISAVATVGLLAGVAWGAPRPPWLPRSPPTATAKSTVER